MAFPAAPSVTNTLVVTHIEYEGPLFVLWGQEDHKSANEMKNLINKTYGAHFDSGLGALTNAQAELKSDAVLIGKLQDNQYYRVRIKSVNLTNQSVKAIVVDYGCIQKLKFSNLRIIKLPPEKNFLLCKNLATKFILSNIVLIPNQGDAAVSFSEQLILNKKVNYTVIDSNINSIDVNFESNRSLYNLTQTIISRGYGSAIQPEEQYYVYQKSISQDFPVDQLSQPPPMCTTDLPPGVGRGFFRGTSIPQQPTTQLRTASYQTPVPGVPFPMVRPVNVPPFPTTAPPPVLYGGVPSVTPAVPVAAPANTYELLPGKIYKVLVTCVENDMTVIVQKRDTVENELAKLMSAINAVHPRPFQKTIQPGTFCLARYSEDQKLCRGIVIRVCNTQDKCEVYYNDFGNKEDELPVSEIFELPDQFAFIPNMAFRCVLANVDFISPITPHVVDVFEKLVNGKVLDLKVLPSQSKTKTLINLSFEDGRKVIDAVGEETKPLAIEAVHIPKGQSVEVVISHVVNAARFYVQLTSNQAGLDKLMEEVEKYCLQSASEAGPFSEEQLAKGDLLCCALYPDEGKWYRAIVIDYHPPSMVTVRYVDYGNESEVSIKDIIEMPRHLVKFRSQAVECCLNGYTSRRETDEESERFEMLLAQHDYTFIMTTKMHLQGSILLVELWDKNNQNVKNILLTMAKEAESAKAAAAAEAATAATKQFHPHQDSTSRSDTTITNKESTGNVYGSTSNKKYGDRERKLSRHSGDEGSDGGGGGYPKKRFNIDNDRRSRPGEMEREPKRDFERKSRYGDSNDRKSHEYVDKDRRQSRYGDDSERNTRHGESNERRPKWGNDSTDAPSNRFKIRERSSSVKSGDSGRESSWKKKSDDFTSDSWKSGKSFDSKSRNFAQPPQKPKLLDAYPSGNVCTALELIPHSEHQVSITHYESPDQFWVQLISDHQTFLSFMNGIQSDYIQRTPIEQNNLNIGQHVIAQFKDDKALYRAQILNILPEITVRYLDYGNVSTVASNRVWTISSDHCVIPIQSVHCKLANVTSSSPDGVWPGDCLKLFTEDQYTMILLSLDETSQATVNLVSVHTGKQVAALLAEAGLGVLTAVEVSVESPVDEKLLINQLLAIHVAYIESSNKFFINVEPDKLDVIAEKVKEIVSKPEELITLISEEIKEGIFVIATTDSAAWYRARVISQSESGVRLQFIDYGDCVEVAFDNVRFLPEPLCNWSPQAFECHLHGLNTVLDETQETEFAELYSDTNITVLVTDVDEQSRLSLLLYSESGEIQTKFQSDISETFPKTVSSLCNYPVLRQGDKVKVSHSTSNYFFIQSISRTDELNSFVDDLHVFYSATELATVPLEVNTICAALSVEFDTWYRAKIISVEPLEIFYIDFGNAEVLPNENLKPLDESHYYPPAFSLKVTLPVTFLKDSYEVLSVDEVYTVEYAQRQTEENNQINWIVNLIETEGSSLIEKLTLSGIVKVEESPFVNADHLLDRLNKIGITQVTVMSYESPSDFVITFETDLDQQETFNQSLQKYANKTLPILGNCAEMCLGKFSDDNLWYRTIILDSEFQGLFIDYGNKDIVPEIRKLSYDLRRVPPFSLKCTLPVSLIGEEWSQEANDRFDSLVNEKSALAKLLNYEEKPVVDLIVDGKSVSDILIEEKLASRIITQAYITQVVSADELYIQMCESSLLGDIYKVLEKIEINVPLTEVFADDILAAKYPLDGLWYRAKVIKKTGEPEQSTFEIFFIDFGDTLEASDFRTLPQHIEKIPPLAKKCSLKLPENVEVWPETSKIKLTELAAGGETKFNINFVDYEKNVVEVFDLDNQNIASILLEPPALKHYILTHINSANDFFMQEVDDPNVQIITEQTAQLENEPSLETVKVGDVIAARFIDDGFWYRAKVTSNENNSIEVIFIDYGNKSIATEFRNLSSSLKSFDPVAVHCKLILPEQRNDISEYSKEATEKFINLSQAGETVYTCDFISKANDLNLVDIYIEEDRVVDLLAEIQPVQKETSTLNVPELTPRKTPVTTESEKCTICWVNSADDFYIQEPDDGTLDTLADSLFSLECDSAIEVVPGDIVAAQFTSDDQWYRAKVIKKSETDETQFDVLFIDYGNTSLASNFRKLPEELELTKIPAHAKHCRLLPPGNLSSWPESASELLNNQIGTYLKLEFIEESEIVSTVELYVDDKRLSHIIANYTDETDAVIEENKLLEPIKEVIGLPEETISESVEGSSNDILTNEEPIKTSSPKLSLKEKARSTEKNKVHLITHVNSPLDFYLMIDAESSIEIGKLLNNASDFERVDSVILGSTYAVFSSSEDSWHRAKLLSIEDDEDDGDLYAVKYIDFGHTDIVSKHELRELPEYIRQMPDVVKNCELETNDEFILWTDLATKTLTDLLVSGQFYIEKITQTDPAKVILKTTDGINVNEMILKINEEAEQQQNDGRKDDVNDTLNDTLCSDVASKQILNENVIVTHFNSQNDFYVQISKDVNILNSVNNLLTTLKPLSLDNVEVNELYAGKNEKDGHWYRVEVKSDINDDTNVKSVEFIDYGYIDQCKEFKQLTEDLKHISKLCHLCSFKHIIQGDNIDEMIGKLIENEEFIVRNVVLASDDKPDIVELEVKSNGKSFDDLIQEHVNANIDNDVQIDENVSVKNDKIKISSSIEKEVIPITDEKELTSASDETKYIIKNDEKEVTPKTEEKELTSESDETKKNIKNDEKEVTSESDEENGVNLNNDEKEITLKTDNEKEVTRKSDENEVTMKVDEKELNAKVDTSVQNSNINITTKLGENGLSAKITDGKNNVEDTIKSEPKEDVTKNSHAAISNVELIKTPAKNVESSSGGVPKTSHTDIKTPESNDESFVSAYETTNDIIDSTETDGGLTDEENLVVYITQINNINDFYIQFDKDTSNLNFISTHLEDFIGKPSNIVAETDVNMNDIYVSKYSDEIYYRVRVLAKLSEGGFNVLFIDYGNEDKVTELYKLPNEINLNQYKPVAFQCEFKQSSQLIKQVDLNLMNDLFVNFNHTEYLLKLKSFELIKEDDLKYKVEISLNERNEDLFEHMLNSVHDDVDK